MYQTAQNRLRQDLTIVKSAILKNARYHYLIKLPESEDFFELGEEDYYLCWLMNGELTDAEICNRFCERFGRVITTRNFKSFSQRIDALGLLEPYHHAFSVLEEPEPNLLLDPPHNISEIEPEIEPEIELEFTHSYDIPESKSYNPIKVNPPYHWALFNPNFGLRGLATLCHPLRHLTYGIIPLLGLAILTILNNQPLFWQDLTTEITPIPLLSKLGFNLLSINILGKVAYGVVYTYYGGRSSTAGIQFIFGFFPLFYLQTSNLWQFRRQQLLWIFATPLLFRIFAFSGTTLLWFWLRLTQPQLSIFFLMLSQISLLSFALHVNPIWKSHGHLWLSTYLRSPQLLEQAHLLINLRIKRRPMPLNLSPHKILALQIYGVVVILSWILLLIAIVLGGMILTDYYQGIGFLISVTAVILTIKWWLTMNGKSSSGAHSNSKSNSRMIRELNSRMIQELSTVAHPANANGSIALNHPPRIVTFLSTTLKIGAVIGVGILLCLPYRYRPGGGIELLTHQQKEIQVDISGRIAQVKFDGGDGAWINAGTTIAEIEPSSQVHYQTPTENDLLIKREQINRQRAEIEKVKANLNRLLSTPRQEEVDVSQRKIEVEQQELASVQSQLAVAREELNLAQRQVAVQTEELAAVQSRVETVQEEVKVAQKDLEAAQIRLEFQSREANRLQVLYQEGAIPLQDLEDAQRLTELAQAEVDREKSNIQSKLKQVDERQHEVQVQRNNIEEEKQNILVKQKQVEERQNNVQAQQKNIEVKRADLSLIMSGSHPDEIAAARKDVEAAQLQLKQLEQDITYTQTQLERRTLVMPFDGRLTTPYLTQKVGSYLDQGQVFAIAEDDRKIRGEIEIPESDIGEFSVGAPVEIKLSSYPNQVITGEIVSIEPNATESSSGQFIKAIVEIPNTEQMLKPGMTGHAKISGGVKPVMFSFTRPLVRFFQIEVWSWIP
ncbi:MAG: HlyD family secretion protein [Microcoleaceae cyanobacterium]